MEIVKSTGEGPLDSWDADIMDMVRHQTVGPDFNRIADGAFPKPSKVESEILFRFEDPLLVVPPLGNLVRVTDNCRTG